MAAAAAGTVTVGERVRPSRGHSRARRGEELTERRRKRDGTNERLKTVCERTRERAIFVTGYACKEERDVGTKG